MNHIKWVRKILFNKIFQISVSILFNEQADQAIDIRKFWSNLVRINNYRQKNGNYPNGPLDGVLKCYPKFNNDFIGCSDYHSGSISSATNVHPNKVGCLFHTVIVSIVPHAEVRENDHLENAPLFT